MTYELCTLFDTAYLPRGLALYRSLVATGADFRLRVFCMDEETYTLLSRLNLPQLRPVELAALEAHDTELLAVKPTRTQLEFCWTATPAVCLYCLETEPELESITYLDADLMFFSDPAPIFQELGSDSVLIVPHRFAPEWAADVETSGIYNVQFMTFRRSDEGLTALRWWRERCLEWCYARVEDGKMGDQKYLDDWPERFAGVHVLEHPGGGLAPWNQSRYALARSGDSVLVDGLPLVFYHFHSLRLYRGVDLLGRARLIPPPYRFTAGPTPLVWSSGYPLGPDERRLVWDPYIRLLGRSIADVRSVDPAFGRGFTELRAAEVAEGAGRLLAMRLRALLGRGRRGLRQLDPDRIPAIGKRRHRNSWRSAAVASQMSELAEQQLRSPETVAPYRAFLEAMTFVRDELPLPDAARFLDFGCGVGHYSELLERSFPGRFAYTGCDYAEEMVAAARARWPGREFVVNDILANALDLDDFHVICAGALVDVVAEWEQALDTLLASGAPYVLLHRQRISDERSSVEVAGGYRGQKTHVVRLTLPTLERIATRHGRSIERAFHVEGEVFSFLLARSTHD